ncbi:hypothetical protein ACH4ZU_26245 [Streptomyces sp. NPDC020472]|uniref:hypothetical protein n=1 Tax=Streptomyces sp. NPDC020472 TaxID=3365075 RepID=UPI0037A017F1
MTRNHIEARHEGVLLSAPERIGFGTVLRGSLLPILVWAGVACFVSNPLVATVLGRLFALSFIVGVGLRHGAKRSVRRSVYGALGGVPDKSLAGF